MRISLLQFPGSNCDTDCILGLKKYFGIDVKRVWHTDTMLPASDGVIVPGGFSFGDYLRSGALASHSPIVKALHDYVGKGGAVIGICNGFQILTEARLLPGALLRNASLQFVCEHVELLPQASGPWAVAKEKLCVPIAHGDGRYVLATDDELKRLQDNGQIAFTYARNPNGSMRDIAGVTSKNGRVMGLMPHPERALNALTGGSEDGRFIWQSFLNICGS